MTIIRRAKTATVSWPLSPCTCTCICQLAPADEESRLLASGEQTEYLLCRDGAGHSPGSCKKKTTEVSKEESSLRSSYDTDNTNFNGVHSRNARSSPAQQIAQASGSNAPKSKANAAFSAGSTALKAPILRSQEGKPLSQPQGKIVSG